jgi:hypothetical protein
LHFHSLKKSDAQKEFQPQRFGSPQNTITPEQVIRHYRKRRGGQGGQALFFPLSYQFFVFHIRENGIIMKDPRFFIMFA